jgi:hypothetical protein
MNNAERMNDAQFLSALEGGELPTSEFGHVGHVRAGYLYLLQGEFGGALQRIRQTLRHYAEHHGKPGLYHETITVAYMALINEHLRERGGRGGWPAFARDNAELLQPGLLRQFYPQAQLDTDRAREVFLLPRMRAMSLAP